MWQKKCCRSFEIVQKRCLSVEVDEEGGGGEGDKGLNAPYKFILLNENNFLSKRRWCQKSFSETAPIEGRFEKILSS